MLWRDRVMLSEIYRPLQKLTAKSLLSLSLVVVTFGTAIAPALAGDPFRSQNPRPISNQTEQGFNSLFKEGNYPQSRQYLEQAYQNDTKDPLIPALLAALAYGEQDWSTLNRYAQDTKTRANSLVTSDKLRGNLYLGVGHFLEGAYLFQTKGAIAALGKVPTATSYLDKAKQENSSDPEYNLVRGYLDLLLSSNLPFANIDQAVDRLEDYGSPAYLVNRGIAIAYRDLEKLSDALSYVNLALATTSNNPDLHYLKAQILHMQANREKNDMTRKASLYREANRYFDLAYQRRSQLPTTVATQLERERNKAQRVSQEFLASQS